MKIDVHTLSDILLAHRRAMALYRKECMPLGRNAIEVMLYAYGKHGITATQISQNLLHSNITQTKRLISILVSKGVLWSYGKGLKRKPRFFQLTEDGKSLMDTYCHIIYQQLK